MDTRFQVVLSHVTDRFANHLGDRLELKQQVEREVLQFEGGDALVIQRIAEDRLSHMDEDTRTYWLYSSYYDSLVLHGVHPSQLLPPPAAGMELATRLRNILLRDTDGFLQLHTLDRKQSREFAKRILNLVTLPALATGRYRFVAPLEVRELDLPHDIKDKLEDVIEIYRHASDGENGQTRQIIHDTSNGFLGHPHPLLSETSRGGFFEHFTDLQASQNES